MLSKMLSDESASPGAGTKPSKVCGVCGDRAKSYHFGGISCDSCKAFFRRSVQNDAHRAFQCAFQQQQQQQGSGVVQHPTTTPAGRHCDINMSNRKCCQFCRFRKCLNIGMEPSWVMTEEERVHMLRARMVKRQRTGHHVRQHVQQRESEDSLSSVVDVRSSRQRSTPAPSPPATSCRMPATVDSESDYPDSPTAEADDDVTSDVVGQLLGLTRSEEEEMEVLVAGFRRRFAAPSALPAARRPRRSRTPSAELSMILLFVVTIQKLVRFARGVNCFAKLPLHLQMSLLRANIFEMFLVVHFCDIDDIDVLPFDTETIDGGTWNGGLDNRRKRKLKEEDEEDEEENDVSSDFVSICPFLSGPGCRGEKWERNCAAKSDGDSVGCDTFPFGGRMLGQSATSPLVSAFRDTVRDSRTMVLLLMVVLFCPDTAPTDPERRVERRQLHYSALLGKQLMQSQDGHDHGQLAKLLLLLPGLREIKETHVSHHFDLSNCDDLDIAELLRFNNSDDQLTGE